jgi:16S rRNA (uracil1498-N3)-methyltransferase
MTRRRWIADQVRGNRAALVGEHAAHLARVLRAQVGQEFDITAGGVVRRGRVVSANDGRVEFELGEEVEAAPATQVTLALAIFKFDRMEWAIEKLTELGVAEIVPVVAGRTAQHLAKAAEARVERWRKIARESSQQARRLAPPEVAAPIRIASLAQQRNTSAIVLSEVEDSVSLKAAVAGCRPPLALAFGPEGGWTPEELQQFETAGWKPASLGQTILRAETAAIAAVAVVMAELS